MPNAHELLVECLEALNEIPNTKISTGSTYDLAARLGKYLRGSEGECDQLGAMYLVHVTPGGMADSATVQGPFLNTRAREGVAQKLMQNPESLVLSLDLKPKHQPAVVCY